ncbi:unnamed protein product [Protopolystoma xenopodis]|uniref:Origin recognition complex subunit 5 C-terminal domain-containing protein n=1 Tax=Protopolystoma xenopodis TaxID=117903 RepID=A0A448WLJ0_9PLAT|nr:unnamed protein product [Protopolystoma xenopodis]
MLSTRKIKQYMRGQESLIGSHFVSPQQRPYLCCIFVTRCPWYKFHSGTFHMVPFLLSLSSYTKDQAQRILLSIAPYEADSKRFANFVDLLLTVNWPIFEEAIINGVVAPDDEWGHWRHAQPILKRSLSTLYMRLQPLSGVASDVKGESLFGERFNFQTSLNLELPYYSRFLLIASYLASYNPRSADKKFFEKV